MAEVDRWASQLQGRDAPPYVPVDRAGEAERWLRNRVTVIVPGTGPELRLPAGLWVDPDRTVRVAGAWGWRAG